MARCEVCGNEYDKSFDVTLGGKQHVFDSFECAIHALAPICAHCGCRVIGHGVEVGSVIYCWASRVRHNAEPNFANREPLDSSMDA